MLVLANHVDIASAFFLAPSLLLPNLYTVGQACDGHADNLLFLHGLFSSCDTLFPSVPLFHRSVFTVAPHWGFSL